MPRTHPSIQANSAANARCRRTTDSKVLGLVLSGPSAPSAGTIGLPGRHRLAALRAGALSKIPQDPGHPTLVCGVGRPPGDVVQLGRIPSHVIELALTRQV